MIMKPLPATWTKHGARHKVARRHADVVLVEVQRNSRTFYEVALVQRHNGYTIAGHTMPPAEHMPRTEQWGICGWSYADKAAAMARFDQCIRNTAALRRGEGQDSGSAAKCL